jgi:hypothetical protein
MIALGTIADLKPDEIWAHAGLVMHTVETGSVITTVWGVKTLSQVAASGSEQHAKIFPFLLNILRTCIPRDVPLHAEAMLTAVDDSVRTEFLQTLEARQPELSPAQLTRYKKVLKKMP